MSQPKAAILAIGDELLSGRTRDLNIHHLAKWLGERGIGMNEARIVSDEVDAIATALNVLRKRHDYVFTSGGIGPTHDDITYKAVASAFGVKVVENPQALKLIEDWYTAKNQEVTDVRRRMAQMPEGAKLIFNKESGAPGVQMENVFVMAGVPRIFNAMLGAVEGAIEGGAIVHSFATTAMALPESKLAKQLENIQSALKGVSLGSYPIDGDELGVTVIARSENESTAKAAIDAVVTAMRALGIEPEISDHKSLDR